MSHREPHAATEPRTGTVMGMRGCESATECSSDRPGHRLNAMARRLAATTASKWVDGFVVSTDDAGFATIADFDGGTARRVWHHDAFAGALRVGDPVAVHAIYGVLARGAERFSVAYA
ncbi:hypothetical protein LQ757_17775 [Agromyces sp. SYSU K20354]|uniref:hypothetical protein n=1 Tax=Agromyces cavernae TaxID=2898659 RepID=UPI001E65198F|nr:hypothetical protein [Agromyces cavernae]MCD2444137.1 hypothetical protein [Agromyces cavernae]